MLFAFGFSEFHVEGPTTAVLWVSGLETHNMSSENCFVKPRRNFTAQFALAFRCVEMGVTVERVAGKGRRAFASNYQYQTHSALPLI